MPRRLYTFSARITIGAQAFVRDDRLDPRRNVVLNLEARGTSGPALMFQSSSENASVIPALASVKRPITSPGWEACYQVLPGDTDFTVFRNAGFAGMNFAFFCTLSTVGRAGRPWSRNMKVGTRAMHSGRLSDATKP
jgi:hypothetical protein